MYPRNREPNFKRVLFCGRGSVLLRRRCNMLLTSGFVDDVKFSYDGSDCRVTPPHVTYDMTPRHVVLLRAYLDDGRACANARRAPRARGAGAKYAMRHCLVCTAMVVIQLAHAVDECIFYREGWRRASFQITVGFLVSFH